MRSSETIEKGKNYVFVLFSAFDGDLFRYWNQFYWNQIMDVLF